MKKYTLLLLTFLTLSCISAVASPPPPPRHWHCCHHAGYDYPYIRYQTVTESEVPVKDCDKHFIEVQTIVTDYSNNYRNTTRYYTAYDKDGNIIVNNCGKMKHIIRDGKCYFIIRFYESEFLGSESVKSAIICSDDNFQVNNKYTLFKEIGNNKYLVRKNGLYGIIDIDENEIVPIKYDLLEQMNNGIYKTKMNGAYGVISMDGDIILPCENDKIKKLGNLYYQVKKDNKWGIISSEGKIITPIKYKDVKISKNILYTKEFGGSWIKLSIENDY